MEQLVLNIKHPRKLSFIKELLSAFSEYVEVVEKSEDKKLTENEKEFLIGLDSSVAFVNNHKKAKATSKTFKQMLDEL
ncbi:MAG: hypothetical protein LBE36_07680 [Flavobacteriaceae bacterium]|jgi:helix-turn-helix protein|nr:hypothetical protein [Flavobacteriaceae bacterium]